MENNIKDFESNFRNLKGTFSVENMNINSSTVKNLKNLMENKETCETIVNRLVDKYLQRN